MLKKWNDIGLDARVFKACLEKIYIIRFNTMKLLLL